jgi:hypothetical protein
MNSAFKISAVYVLTRDNWLLDRFLGMARKGLPLKQVEKFTHFCVCELDENKRFVYSQVYFQANWLKFQVFRPRDKSSNKVSAGSHLRNLGFSSVSPLNDDKRLANASQMCSNMWEVDATIRTNRNLTHHASGSEFSFFVSEPHYNNEVSEDFNFSSDDEIY